VEVIKTRGANPVSAVSSGVSRMEHILGTRHEHREAKLAMVMVIR
jgi:hypothetical protein